MKIIEPSVELIDAVNPEEVLKKIERCGRVCYQSKPRDDSAEQFVRMLIKSGHESVLEHVSLTFHIICDRAIQNELVRHRLASFSVESTRFVKYDKLTIINNNPDLNNFIENNERMYRLLLMTDYPPEIARTILPLCLKTELFMTANLREWRHILKLRTAKAAHPQMRFIAGQILSIFKEKLPVIVEDIGELIKNVNDRKSMRYERHQCDKF